MNQEETEIIELINNTFPFEVPSSEKGLKQVLQKIAPFQDHKKFLKSLQNIFDFMNGNAVLKDIPTITDEENHHFNMKQRNIQLRYDQFIYYTNEYLLFTQFQDDSLRKYIQRYREIKEDHKLQIIQHKFTNYDQRKIRPHYKTIRLADLACFMIYDDFNFSKIVMPQTICHKTLEHLFGTILGIKFPKLRAFKDTLKAFEP